MIAVQFHSVVIEVYKLLNFATLREYSNIILILEHLQMDLSLAVVVITDSLKSKYYLERCLRELMNVQEGF